MSKKIFALAAVAVLAACNASSTGSVTRTFPTLQPLPAGVQVVTLGNGLQYADITVGSGAVATDTSHVSLIYTGWLQNGTGFDSNANGAGPLLSFQLGQNAVIPGFEQGIVGMRVGGTRRLIIPPALGYGNNDVRDPNTGVVVIPAGSTIVFDVQLVSMP